MAIDNVLSKQPSEAFFIQADFSKLLNTGETVDLNNSTVSAVNAAGADKTSTVLDNTTKAIADDGNGLVIKVKAGVEAESPYKITFLLKTVQGSTWELDVDLYVKEQ